jgi:hypothetical protein
MKCPYLSAEDEKKICQRMTKEKLDGEVSEFDIKQYCTGNPVHCYYFRTAPKDLESVEKKQPYMHSELIFKTISRSLEAGMHLLWSLLSQTARTRR